MIPSPRRALASAVASLLGVTVRAEAEEANARAAKLMKYLELYEIMVKDY